MQRRGALALTGAVVLALLVAAAGVWLVHVQHATRDVSISVAGAPTCSGTTVSKGVELVSAHAIHAHKGMHCLVPLAVTNHGGRTVTLDQVEFVGLGPGTLFLQRDPRPAPGMGRPHLIGLQDDVPYDVYYRVHRTLTPGRTLTFTLPLVWDDAVCKDANRHSGYGFSGESLVRVSSWGHSEDREAGNNFIADWTPNTSDCPGLR